MQLKPLYMSAPSRSGSSLLIKMLNCTSNMVVVNEPINSVNIVDRNNIEAIFDSLKDSLRQGFVPQRVDETDSEATDTFPPSKMKWGKINRSFEGMEVVGIKKSFPAFSNKDFFQPFIQEWPAFVKWMSEQMNGGVVVIVRDPRFTILSWKTTFEALKEKTEKQCYAWNLIASTILASKNLGVKIVRYEDLVQNPVSVIETIADYLGTHAKLKEVMPPVRQFVLEDYLNNKGISRSSAEVDFRIVEAICGDIAKEFGYARMYS